MLQQSRRVLSLVLGLAAITLLGFAPGCGSEKKGLTITKIEPKVGPHSGGSSVTIHGTGFQSEGAMGVKVYFGKKKAGMPSFEGDTKLHVQPPSGKAGDAVDVTLIFDDGRQKTFEKAYSYVDMTEGMTTDDLTDLEKKK